MTAGENEMESEGGGGKERREGRGRRGAEE